MTAKESRQAAQPDNSDLPGPLPASIFDLPFDAYVGWIVPWLFKKHEQTGVWPKYSDYFQDQAIPSKAFEQLAIPGLSLQLVSSELLESKKTNHRHPKSGQRTNFNYRQSPYWTAAGQLIDTQARRPVAAELRFGCQHVLSLILAWMNFPLFNTGGRSGLWMTLGCDRMSRELRVTSRNVLSYIYELEHCDLIMPGKLETGLIGRGDYDSLKADVAGMGELLAEMPGVPAATSFLHQRCIQVKSTFYRLKAGIARPSLPVFNPFSAKKDVGVEAETTEKDVGRTCFEQEKDVQGQLWAEMDEKRTCPTSFPRPHDHEYEHDYESPKEESLIRDMNPARQVLFSLLKEANKEFPGSKCGPMDPKVAADLAVAHTEGAVKAALAKVKRDWAKNGHLIENPVALFISEIPKQAERLAQPTGWTRPAKKGNSKKGPIDFDKYTTGKYAHLVVNSSAQVQGEPTL